MASTLHPWESDPLFSAAEVVQDSADRMESIYRLLLHEQSLVHGDHPDPRFLTSIDYHRRDLATILETTKWQLEDFERAVSSSIDKSQTMEDMIFRHKQFIRAIGEQINQVEKSLEDASMGKLVRNTEWVNLNKQDRDGLALFLSGGIPAEHIDHSYVEDSNILRRFLDPAMASNSKDEGIIEHESGEAENLKMNGVHGDHYYGSVKENNLMKVSSIYSTRSGLSGLDSLQETSCSRHNEDVSWDLEANDSRPKSFFQESRLKGHYSRIFGYLNSLWTAYGSRVNRNYTKRLKDGEERNSPSHIDVSHAVQPRIGVGLASRDACFQLCSGFLVKPVNLCIRVRGCRSMYQRLPYHAQVNQHSMKLILAAIVSLTVLGEVSSPLPGESPILLGFSHQPVLVNTSAPTWPGENATLLLVEP